MKRFLLLLFILFPVYVLFSQVTINVPGDYSTIQAAINAANNGDLVLVADGTYIENINFKGKAITVASHFWLDENIAHIENTVIDGSQPSHTDTGSVVIFNSGEDTSSVFCGFTITGGSGTYYSPGDYRIGGGIMLFYSGAKICHNIITLNTIENTTTYTRCYGGGILAAQSPNLIIANNVISENLIENYSAVGGGISVYYTGPTWITSNEIIGNIINCNSGSGGGIDIWSPVSELYARNNIIRGNQAITNNYGGGGISIYNSSSPLFISNNLIAENQGFHGGGILVENSTGGNYEKMNSFDSNNYILGENCRQDNNFSPTDNQLLEAVIENNTIVDNTATSYCGGIICINTAPEIKNCIVWGNNGPGTQIHNAGLVEYSDVEGGYTGTGNIDSLPQFVSSQYYLLANPTSPCIDAGNTDPMSNDVENPDNPGYALFPALVSLTNDMGAFGGPNSTWSLILSDTLQVPEDCSTIQAAIDASINGHVVLVDEGIYYENINYRGKAITVASHFLVDGNESHIENTIIDGSQPNNPDSGSVVYFISGEDTTSILYGFTITGGTGTYDPYPARVGGGIACYNSGAKILNNIILDNHVVSDAFITSGGGINCGFPGDTSWIVIENNTIINNSVTSTAASGQALGGGIDLVVNARVINNIIEYNTAKSTNGSAWGGGVVLGGFNGQPLVRYCIHNIIWYNKAISPYGTSGDGGVGGGLVVSGTPEAVIRLNDIRYNEVESNTSLNIDCWGGGVMLQNQTYKTVFSENYVAFNRGINNSFCKGAGVTVWNYDVTGGPQIINNIITNNSGGTWGGGLFLGGLVYNDATLINNTIHNNSATLGGAIYVGHNASYPADPKILNSIMWNNSSSIYVTPNSSVTILYSNIQGGWPGEGNIDEDPLFMDPTNGNFMLQDQVSPCLEKGIDSIEINSVMYYCPPFCINGVPRPSPAGTMPDIGACENPIPVGVDNDLSLIPDEYSLSQNYPNPFNPTTTIKYGLPEITFVELKVYDILGSEITTLVNEERDAGYYETNFNDVNLSSGIYFYQLKTGKFIETRKMILLK